MYQPAEIVVAATLFLGFAVAGNTGVWPGS